MAAKGIRVSLLARTEKEATDLQNNGLRSSSYPINDIEANLTVTEDPAVALAESKAIILAVPSQTMRVNVQIIKPHITSAMLIASAAKGLEIGSNKRMSQVIAEEINPHYRQNICVLSGPNLAREILMGRPAATIAAAEDKDCLPEHSKAADHTQIMCLHT